MGIKDVCFVNCEFALFISIYFIIVIINMIRINPNLYDLTRLHKSKNFEGFSEVVAIDRTFVSLKLVNYDVEFN